MKRPITQSLCFIFLFVCQFSSAQKFTPVQEQYFKKIVPAFNQYLMEGKTDSMFYVAENFYPIAMESGDIKTITNVYGMLGGNYQSMGDYGSGLEYYLKAVALVEKNEQAFDSSFTIPQVYSDLSMLFFEVGNYPKSMEAANKAINYFLKHTEMESLQKSNYYYGLSNSFGLIGGSQLMLKQPEKALQSQLKALKYAMEIDTTDYTYSTGALSYVYTDLARVYFEMKDDKAASQYFLKATALNKKYNIPSSANNNYYSEFLYQHNKTKDAISAARAGLDDAIASQDKSIIIKLADNLQKAYDKEQNIDSAYFYSKMVIAYRDSIFNSQKMMTIQNLTFKRQNDEREAALEKVKREEERKQNLQNAAIAIGIIAFLILFFIVSHRVRVHKNIIRFLGALSMLLVFEFLNLLLHPFIGEITHHRPVFMLLCLAAIAAVLIPLHHKLEHWITHKLLEKNTRLKLQAVKDAD